MFSQADICEDAFPECDLNQLSSVRGTNSAPGTGAGGDVCNGAGVIHNAIWYGIQAQATEMDITVNVSNCVLPTPPLPNCNDAGVQIAVWGPGCPGDGGTCIGGSAACTDVGDSYTVSGLIVGQNYYVLIDGCCSAVCDFDISVSAAVWEPDFNPPNELIATLNSCTSPFPENVFCPGATVTIDVDDTDLQDRGADWFWSISGPAGVDYVSGNFSGSGSNFQVGDIANNDPGFSLIEMVFSESGMYTICLDDIVTDCDSGNGPTCLPVTIISNDLQDFGTWDLCEYDFVQQNIPFLPPSINAAGIDFEWNGGEEIFATDLGPTGGSLTIDYMDDCGCTFQQTVIINIVGFNTTNSINIELYDCQLPYTFEGVEISDIAAVNGDIIVLPGASTDQDYTGRNCDLAVELLITEIVLLDSLIIGNCGPNGVDITPDVYRADNTPFDFNNPTYSWYEPSDPLTILSTQATFNATSGVEYKIDIVGEITDFYTGNASTCAYTACIIAPAGGVSANPVAMSYDAVICEDEVNNINLGVNQEPNVTYQWNLPPGYSTGGPINLPTITVSILNYDPLELLTLTVTGECGSPQTLQFPIEVQSLPAFTIDIIGERCEGETISLSYDGDPTGVSSYEWDVAPGNITNGINTTQEVDVVFSDSGDFTYMLTIFSSGGCEESFTNIINIGQELDNPMIICDIGATTSNQIVFTWDPVDGANGYSISDLDLPPGATGTWDGMTTYTVTGVSPGDEATIQVEPLGSNCGFPSSVATCMAASVTCNPPAPSDIGNFNPMSFCAGAMANTPVQFTVNAPAGYTGTYSGNGVTTTGLFDPDDSSVTIGNNAITYTYVDDTDPSCSQSVVATMTVGQTPTVSLGIDVADVCQGEPVVLSGPSAADNPIYDYGSGDGDFNGLTFNDAGPAAVSVTVTDVSGCTNEASISFTVVEALEPIIVTCTPSTEDVTFTWNEVTNASNYTITYTDQNGTVTTDDLTTIETSFLADNLMEGDDVSLVVTANHPNPNCMGVTGNAACTAVACDVPVISVTATQQEFCSNDPVGAVNIDVLVNGVPPATGTGVIVGDGVSQVGDNAVFDPASVMTGNYTAVFSYTSPIDNCVTTEDIEFVVSVVPVPVITASELITCVDQAITIDHTGSPDIGTESWVVSGANEINMTATDRELSWSSPGIYPVTLTYSVPGCNPESSTVMIEVVEAATIPMISCEDSGTDFIQFGWNDQSQFMYEVFLDGVSQGIQSESEYRAVDLIEGQEVIIRVVVIDPVCGNQENSRTCNASACNVAWNVTAIPDEICFTPGDAPIELMVSGFDPFMPAVIIDAEWQNPEIVGNLFTPNPGSAEYTLLAVYNNGNCSRDTSFVINVYDTPEFSLSASAMTVCEGETATIEYDYTGPGNEVLLWDFGGATELTSADGSQDVSLDAADTYTVTLQIDNNGCPSDIEEVIITAEPELIVPVLSCGAATITSAEFTWDAVDCASEYIISVDGAVIATQAGTSYTVEDLLSEQSVEVTVEAVSDCACGNVISDAIPCESLPCPVELFDFSRDPLDAVCIDLNAMPFTITATPQTLPGNGTGSWTTTPFLSEDGNIDPSLASPGTTTIEYSYLEGVCNYMTTTTITFIEAPSANLLGATDPACPDDTEGTISIEGVNGTPPYMYSLDGGLPQSSGNFDAVSIGAHTVTVIDDNGCESDAAIVDIMAPTTPTVIITGPSTVILDNDGTYELNFNGTLDPTQIENITWTRDDVVVIDDPNGTTYTYASATEDVSLQVTVTYSDGCTVVSEIFVVDVKQIQAFYVPNTVSTQLSGENSTWSMYIKGDEVFPQNIKIYNRWGNLVHSVDWDYNANNLPPEGVAIPLWDGFYGETGPAIVSEVYVYVLSLEYEGVNRVTSGDITIIR